MTAALLGAFTVVALVLVSVAGLTEDLVVGDCLNLPQTAEVSVADTISCDQPHDNEVFALKSVGTELGLNYPGRSEVETFASSACLENFDEYVGIAYQESIFYLTFLYPTSESWADGDRSIVCILFRGDLEKMTRSMRDSGL